MANPEHAAVEHYADRLARAIRARRTAAVVGLDPVVEQLPESLRPRAATVTSCVAALEEFCGEVIRIVAAVFPAVKINSGFFEAYYEAGVAAFYRLIERAHAAGLLVIADVKRGDIGSTAKLYAKGHIARPDLDIDPGRIPDAVTLAGYLGASAVKPFIEYARQTGRGMYVLVRPSDPGADEVHEFSGEGGAFYQHMARLVARWGAENSSLLGVGGLSCVGAVVAPKDLQSTRALRAALPQTPLLVPGYGAQGGALEACQACFLPDRPGSAIVNASRSVIFAFENAQIRERAGSDWRVCVELAAREFATTFPA